MKNHFGLPVVVLLISLVYQSALAADSNFTGTWYVHQDEASEQPDFWEEFKLLQNGKNVCGEWSGGSKRIQRITEGYVVGLVNGNKAIVYRCAFNDTDSPASPRGCPNFSAKWKDVLTRREDNLMIEEVGRDGRLHSDGLPRSRISSDGKVSKEGLRACSRWKSE